MAIELNVNKLNTGSAQDLGDIASGTTASASKALTSLLDGDSVKVTNGALGDLEALVQRLKNENERVKFSILLSSLSSIGQSLTETQKRVIEQGVALSEKLEELEKTLDTTTAELEQDKAASALLQAKIDALQKQIDQAIKDGKDHNELVAEQKRVREELDAKDKVIAENQGKINETKNEISSVKSQISVLLKSIGENAAKTIASELATLSEPEKAERPAEAEKEAQKLLETNPFASIRESLERIERDITETIEENRIETV